jgi:hypothetical protein
MLLTKFPFIWRNSFRGEDFLEINQSEKRIACGSHVSPFLAHLALLIVNFSHFNLLL